MRKRLVFSFLVACAVGCAHEGDGRSGTEGLASEERPQVADGGVGGGDGCEVICASYDGSDCRVVCPPEPPDASIPEDPYAQ